MTTTLRAIALLIAASMLTSGCSTDTDTPAQPGSSSSATPEPTERTPTPDPVSEPAIQAGMTRDYRVLQEITGIVSWEVQPGPGVTDASAKKIGAAADAFINEHLLRPDRWKGKYAIKPGEMDDLSEKFTPSLSKSTRANVAWFHDNQIRHGKKTDGWPKKQQNQRSDRVQRIGAMFITQPLVTDGKGPIRNAVTRRVIYTSEGTILAYAEITGRREDNSGSTKSVVVKIAVKKSGGRWLISGVHWDIS